MNKIISISVWGNDPRYIVGAHRQIELAKKYYPNWKVRIYTDNPENFKEVETVKVEDDSYGMFWRFLPLFESDDNWVMVRDSDSRITIREARAVKEWEESNFTFHVFRDHEAHYEFPIIGTAFAMKGKFDAELLKIMKLVQTSHTYLLDQLFLRDFVWPRVKHNTLVHSMDEEGWFKDTRKQLKNPYSFCGNGYDENDMPLYAPTWAECRNFDSSKLPVSAKFDEGVLGE